MAIMDVPRTKHRRAGRDPWSAAQAADVDDPQAEIEELFWRLDLGPRRRVELLEGQIVVSPKPVFWHERVVTWMILQFVSACDANGWQQTPGADLRLPPTREIIEPDYVIIKDLDACSDNDSEVPLDQILLVSEIVSPSSKRADREVKPLSCAKAGIPLYLLVDRFTQPMSITLLSEPGEDGYGKAESVPAGPGGATLRVPEPFGITIDAATVPEFRGTARSRG
jgi:Uma2 family endonuclease